MFPEPPLYVHRRNFIHEYAGFRPRVGRSTVEKEVILPPGKALVDSTVFECFVDGGDCNSFHAPIVSNRWSLSTLFESISNKVLDFRTILEHPHVTVPVSEWFDRRCVVSTHAHIDEFDQRFTEFGHLSTEFLTACTCDGRNRVTTDHRRREPPRDQASVSPSLACCTAFSQVSSAVTAYSPPRTSGAAYCFSNTSRYISSNSSNSSFCAFKFFRW